MRHWVHDSSVHHHPQDPLDGSWMPDRIYPTRSARRFGYGIQVVFYATRPRDLPLELGMDMGRVRRGMYVQYICRRIDSDDSDITYPLFVHSLGFIYILMSCPMEKSQSIQISHSQITAQPSGPHTRSSSFKIFPSDLFSHKMYRSGDWNPISAERTEEEKRWSRSRASIHLGTRPGSLYPSGARELLRGSPVCRPR